MRAWIPRGVVLRRAVLPDAEWRARHRLLVSVLAAHVPALLAYGLITGHPLRVVGPEVLGIAALGTLAALPGNRLRRSLAATLGLLSCSALLVALTGGSIEAHFHFFVAVIFVALYQDWRALAAALLYVIAEHTVVGVLSYHSVYDHGTGLHSILTLALIHGGYVLVASAALMVFWSYSDRAQAREEEYRQQLLDAEMGALARMREAGQIREDLIASVSHEFRTPLTAIRGAAATLRQRGDQIPAPARDMLLAGICEHGERLTRLLEDMLAAASAAVTDPTAVSDVTAAAEALRSRAGLTVTAGPGLAAYIDGHALTQLVRALADYGLDHAHDHGRGDRPVELSVESEGRYVRLRLSYRAEGARPSDAARVLEPFGSRESAATGRPTSLGLYLARRIAEVNGGTASAAVEPDLVRVDIRLRALRARVEPPAGQRTAAVEVPQSVRTG